MVNLEEFNKLTPEEQTAVLISAADMERAFSDIEAERNSLKEENDKINALIANVRQELQKTKELNYTLARQVKKEPDKDAETLIHEMFK